MSKPITLERNIALVPIQIWSPRYHDNTCLILCTKVKQGRNFKVWFSEANSLKGKLFYISKDTILKYPKESNGSAPCYAVPMDELRPLTIREESW